MILGVSATEYLGQHKRDGFMNPVELEIVQRLITRIDRDGREYSRATLSECYFQILHESNTSENADASEKWIVYMWGKLEQVTYSELIRASASTDKLSKFLYQCLGK